MPAWTDEAGLLEPADFALVLAAGPMPPWPHRRVDWPDFRVPSDRADALDALHEAPRRATAGKRVEVACRGGVGRTGTALAALAVLDGLTPREAVGQGAQPVPPDGRGDTVAAPVAARCRLTASRDDTPSGEHAGAGDR